MATVSSDHSPTWHQAHRSTMPQSELACVMLSSVLQRIHPSKVSLAKHLPMSTSTKAECRKILHGVQKWRSSQQHKSCRLTSLCTHFNMTRWEKKTEWCDKDFPTFLKITWLRGRLHRRLLMRQGYHFIHLRIHTKKLST